MTPATAAANSDAERIAEQEQRLQFERLPDDFGWRIGERLRERALARGAALTIEVRIAGETVFLHAMPGTMPANADWARRKRNTVELLGKSSYRVGRENAASGNTLESRMGLAPRDHADHGGAFPLRVAGLGLVGCVTVSGLPQREDHGLVVEALAEFAGVTVEGLALD